MQYDLPNMNKSTLQLSSLEILDISGYNHITLTSSPSSISQFFSSHLCIHLHIYCSTNTFRNRDEVQKRKMINIYYIHAYKISGYIGQQFKKKNSFREIILGLQINQ